PARRSAMDHAKDQPASREVPELAPQSRRGHDASLERICGAGAATRPSRYVLASKPPPHRGSVAPAACAMRPRLTKYPKGGSSRYFTPIAAYSAGARRNPAAGGGTGGSLARVRGDGAGGGGGRLRLDLGRRPRAVPRRARRAWPLGLLDAARGA